MASFDYPTSFVERLATAALKPLHHPVVRLNGRSYEFVRGTATAPHLVRVPKKLANRRITNAGLRVRTISFPDADEDVHVRFYELPTR